MKRDNSVCWYRNPSKSNKHDYSSIAIPYTKDGKTKEAHPDFIIVRTDPDTKNVIDIMEPHLPTLVDNLPKAKAFAEYAKKDQTIGKIQLIREGEPGGVKQFVRIDLAKTAICEKILNATTPEELNKIFDIDGEYE